MPVTRAGYVHCSILFSIPSYHSIFQFSIYRCPNFSSHFCLLLTFCDTVYRHFNIQQRHKQFCHYRKGLAVLSSEWLPWLQKNWGDNAYEIYMNIRANYISNLSPNHSLQLTTWTCEGVTTSTLKNYDKAGGRITDVQWLLYLQDHMVVIVCSLIEAGVTPSSVVTNCKIRVEDMVYEDSSVVVLYN